MDDPAKPFTDMASRIGAVTEGEFAGAAVVVPRDGNPIIFMLTDPDPKPAQFWAGLQSRVEIGAAEAKDAEQATSSPYGMRR